MQLTAKLRLQLSIITGYQRYAAIRKTSRASCVCGPDWVDDAGVTKARVPCLEQGRTHALKIGVEAARGQHVETSITPDQVECGGTLAL